ncbi:hypothetical protein TNCV_1464561 [Trichonephila clavipes]|nr:hypothetical protein TNCV_1464561 [Trichonephila clavipes]
MKKIHKELHVIEVRQACEIIRYIVAESPVCNQDASAVAKSVIKEFVTLQRCQCDQTNIRTCGLAHSSARIEYSHSPFPSNYCSMCRTSWLFSSKPRLLSVIGRQLLAIMTSIERQPLLA